MCHFIIELQESVKSQANFLELLENRTPIIFRNFGAESDKAKEHLETVVKYKLELISRERELSDYIASNKGANLLEPCDLAMLVNNAIDSINELVTNGVIINNLQAIASYIRDNEYSFNKANSQVSGMLIEHYSNHNFLNDKSEEALADTTKAETLAEEALANHNKEILLLKNEHDIKLEQQRDTELYKLKDERYKLTDEEYNKLYFAIYDKFEAKMFRAWAN